MAGQNNPNEMFFFSSWGEIRRALVFWLGSPFSLSLPLSLCLCLSLRENGSTWLVSLNEEKKHEEEDILL